MFSKRLGKKINQQQINSVLSRLGSKAPTVVALLNTHARPLHILGHTGHSSLPDASWGVGLITLGLWSQANADKVLLCVLINHLHHLAQTPSCATLQKSGKISFPPFLTQRTPAAAKLTMKLQPAALGRFAFKLIAAAFSEQTGKLQPLPMTTHHFLFLITALDAYFLRSTAERGKGAVTATARGQIPGSPKRPPPPPINGAGCQDPVRVFTPRDPQHHHQHLCRGRSTAGPKSSRAQEHLKVSVLQLLLSNLSSFPILFPAGQTTKKVGNFRTFSWAATCR